MDKNGPAYPQTTVEREEWYAEDGLREGCFAVQTGGLTKREWFAGMEDPPDDDSVKWICKCLGWDLPEFELSRVALANDREFWTPERVREAFLWWGKASAAWKYARADAMIEVGAEE